MGDGDMLAVRPPPSKADPFALRWGVYPIYLPYSATQPICAARALADLEVRRQPAGGQRRHTPVFVDKHGVALKRNAVTRRFDAWMAELAPGTSKKYSVHSFRIYLANALAVAGASDARIQSMLRWASVEALLCYKQTAPLEYSGWVHAAGAARVDVHRSHHLPADAPPARHSASGAGAHAISASANSARAIALPVPEAPCDPTRAQHVRFEADDIVATAHIGDISALMAEATLYDAELRNVVAHSDDINELLVRG